MSIHITAATGEDFNELSIIAETVWPHSIETDQAFLAKTSRGVLLTARYDNQVVGYGAAFPWYGELPRLSEHGPQPTTEESPFTWWHLHDVAIHPHYRNKGIGSALVDARVQAGKERGYHHMRAIAVSPQGQHLLTKAGFTVDATLVSPEDYHGAPVLTYIW